MTTSDEWEEYTDQEWRDSLSFPTEDMVMNWNEHNDHAEYGNLELDCDYEE